MSKRRGFDIDFPGNAEGVYTGAKRKETPEPAARPEGRRGPMAAAISENADALRQRAEAERAIREENDRLAHEHVRLKRAGLITDLIPLDAIRIEKLTRDRGPGPDPRDRARFVPDGPAPTFIFLRTREAGIPYLRHISAADVRSFIMM